MNRHPAAFLFFSAILGALIGINYPGGWWIGVIISFIVFILFYRINWLLILNVLIFVFFLIAWVASHQVLSYQEVTLSIGQEAHFYQGMVDEVTKLNSGSKVLLAHVKAENSSYPLKVLIRLNEGLAIEQVVPGQLVRFKGIIKIFKKPLSPIHRNTFNYALMKGVHGQISLTQSQEFYAGAVVKKPYFATLRMNFINHILQVLTPYEASMLLALIMGDTHLMAKEQHETYEAIGAQHLLAVSGLQVTILSWLCFTGLRPMLAIFLRAHWYACLILSALFTILLSFWFIGLAGFCASALRAFLMMGFLLLPIIIARRINSFDALYTSGFVTILFMPVIVLDLGFWLSYSAVLGLLCAYAYKELFIRLAKCLYVPSYLAAAFLASMAAFLFTLPIIVWVFGKVAPFSVLANLFLIPLSSIVQVAAILLGLFGVLLNLSFLISAGAFFANIIDIVAQFLAQVLGGVIFFHDTDVLVGLAMMLATVMALWRKYFKLCLLFGGILCASCSYKIFTNKPLFISVLAVGQGDATLFSTPHQKHILLDAGGQPWGDFDPGSRIVVPSLKRRGVKELEVVIITHPDPDHILGVYAVLENFKVKEIWHSGFKPGHPLLKKMLALANQKKIKILSTPDLLGAHMIDGVNFLILAPNTKGHGAYFEKLSSNDNSLVVRIDYGDFKFLWPADIEKKGEENLLADIKDLKVDVVKAPHHGSKTSSSVNFVAATRPMHVIYSTGLDNRFNFPHEEVKNRWQKTQAEAWNTADDGEISIKVFSHHLQMMGFKSLKKASSLRKN